MKSSAAEINMVLQPTALLVLISAGLLLHYNDERRAIPKGLRNLKIWRRPRLLLLS